MGKGLRFFIEMNILIINNVFQMAAWSCSWDLNSSHYMYAGLQVLNCVLFSFTRQLNSVVFFFVCLLFFPPPILNLCRMACLWCLICAKLQGQWQKLVGPQAIPFILYTLFYTTQPSHQVLAPFYLLLQLVCASGTLVEVKRGRLSPKFSWGTSNALQRKRN